MLDRQSVTNVRLDTTVPAPRVLQQQLLWVVVIGDYLIVWQASATTARTVPQDIQQYQPSKLMHAPLVITAQQQLRRRFRAHQELIMT